MLVKCDRRTGMRFTLLLMVVISLCSISNRMIWDIAPILNIKFLGSILAISYDGRLAMMVLADITVWVNQSAVLVGRRCAVEAEIVFIPEKDD